MIDTGESETIFQKAILEQGRGHVSSLLYDSEGITCNAFIPMHTSVIYSMLLGIN